MDIKDKIKEILQDKEIRMSLYNEFEKIICSKFNLTQETKKEKTVGESSESNISEFNKKLKNIEEKLDEKNNDLNKIKSRLDNMESITKTEIDFGSQIEKKIQNNQLIKNISESVDLIKKNMNDKNNNNYIEMKIYNPARDFKKIKILQQNKTYKYFYNFERDDLEVIINGKIVSLDHYERTKDFKEEEKKDNCYKAQRIGYNLESGFSFFVYLTESINTIKIIFKKKLYDCGFLFYNCKDINEINLSNFDCSQVTTCESMFDGCLSLQKLNLGKSDFSLSKSFESMFNNCENLENVDVANFNTENATTFAKMFCGCKKLAKIDVSKFDSSKCAYIFSMFKKCENICEIDMINWDMSHLKKPEYGFLGILIKPNSINYLFDGCKNLKTIKMSANFSDIDKLIYKDNNNEIFKGLSKYGNFYWKKGNNCDKLLSQLPVSWNRCSI